MAVERASMGCKSITHVISSSTSFYAIHLIQTSGSIGSEEANHHNEANKGVKELHVGVLERVN